MFLIESSSVYSTVLIYKYRFSVNYPLTGKIYMLLI